MALTIVALRRLAGEARVKWFDMTAIHADGEHADVALFMDDQRGRSGRLEPARSALSTMD